MFLIKTFSFNCNIFQVIPESLFEEFKEDILEAYDEDGDGRISVHELAEILPTEENFLFLFRLDNWLNSTSDFMKVGFLFCFVFFTQSYMQNNHKYSRFGSISTKMDQAISK